MLDLAGLTLESLQASAPTPTGIPFRELVVRLEKWNLLANSFELKVDHLKLIRDTPALFGNTSEPDLRLIHRLGTYRSLASSEVDQIGAANTLLKEFDTSSTDKLAEVLSIDRSLIASLIESFSGPALDVVSVLRQADTVCELLGINGAALNQITKADEIQLGRDAMKGALLAKYPMKSNVKKYYGR